MYKSSLSTIFVVFFALLAGRAYAMNITLNAGGLVNVTETGFLNISDASLLSSCHDRCQPGNDAISNCANSNATLADQCLCTTDTISKITACEQCYFEQIIKENRPIPGGDIRAGGQTALTAYTTACSASVNQTYPATLTALTVPEGWNGPLQQLLVPATTAITFIAALAVGTGCIGIVIAM